MNEQATNIEEAIRSAMPAVYARAKQEALDNAERSAIQAAERVVSDEATKWATEVLAPEIRANLETMRPEMVLQCQAIANGIAEKLTAGLVESLEEKMQSSWKRREIFEALFK